MTVADWIVVAFVGVNAVLATRQIVGWRRDRRRYRQIDEMLTEQSSKPA